MYMVKALPMLNNPSLIAFLPFYLPAVSYNSEPLLNYLSFVVTAYLWHAESPRQQ